MVIFWERWDGDIFFCKNHWHQWFFDGLGFIQPLVSMVFDGRGPLGQQCDSSDGSVTSSHGCGAVAAQCMRFGLIMHKCV